ncbi:MAG: F0F1 ATP synthase subunit A [Vicinamibacterales bacterium]
MEQLEHSLWIVDFVNWIAAFVVSGLGLQVENPAAVVPNHVVMSAVVVLIITGIGLLIRSQLSVENPGWFQIALEDLIGWVQGVLDEDIGPKGRRYIGLVATIGAFIWVGNLIGQLPGLVPATMDINVTLALALTVWVYYHYQGVKEQGLGAYLKHFAVPPGIPAYLAPIMLPIEVISHFSRVMSLALRLFGNIFGEKLVVLILASIVPFVVPLPIMFLGVIIGTLQALIFVKLTTIYLAGAVATEHDHH